MGEILFMKRRKALMRATILFVFIATFLVGCSLNTGGNDLSVEEVSIDEVIERQLDGEMPKDELKNNVFMIEDDSEEYIVFYEMKIDRDSFSYEVSDSKLKFYIKTSDKPKSTLAYKIISPKEPNYDTLHLIKDGKETAFASIICN